MKKKDHPMLPGDFSGITLDEDQQRVVDWQDGAVVVSAGPGSGKTRVVTERIVRLVRDGIAPERILATTFSRKAKKEMEERLAPRGVDGLEILTIHGLSYHVLYTMDGKKPDMSPVIAGLQYGKIINGTMGDFGMNAASRMECREVRSFISLAKANLVAADESADTFRPKPAMGDGWNLRCAGLYRAVERIRTQRAIQTFDDMLVDAVLELRVNDEKRSLLQRRFLYMLVDEFQDTNYAQMVIINFIAGERQNLMMVGDVDQAIYAFRGAVPGQMVALTESGEASVISLGRNYRSSRNIVERASDCITVNRGRITKELYAVSSARGSVECWRYANACDEAIEVVNRIDEARRDGVALSEMFILYRMHVLSKPFEEELLRRDITFFVHGGGSFFSSREIKGLVAYLELLQRPKDMKAGRTALTHPYRGIPGQALKRIERLVKERNLSYLEAAARVAESTSLMGLERFTWLFGAISGAMLPVDILGTVVRETNYVEEMEDADEWLGRLNDVGSAIESLLHTAGRFGTVVEMLQFVEDQRNAAKGKNGKDAVQLMTMHGAKGLEAALVFIVGANDGIVPISLARSETDVEEERRLFYVAMTRAKKALHISCYEYDKADTPVPPSRFMRDAGIEIFGSEMDAGVSQLPRPEGRGL